MKFFQKLFGKKSTFVGNFVTTGDELLSLAASNKIVAAELSEFECNVQTLTDSEEVKKQAFKSAEALSGYGISVDAKAFLETVE